MSGATIKNLEHWLVSLRAPGLGGAKLISLSEKFGGPDRLRAAPPSALKSAGLDEETIDALKHPDQPLLERDLDWLSDENHHLLTWNDERYPALLRDIPSPPAALYLEGDPDILWQPQIAVIGSRNPTAGGRDNARDFAGELSRRGLTVTSGMAEGVDSESHAAALDAGGYTVAVLGTGTDIVYPASGSPLARRIRQRGALLSEFPPGTKPKRGHFPSRNRIISGLSLGVLVIEAGLRSGTLITARLAAEQGREVLALPGSIHNPLSKGCHRLIREGAKLVEDVSQVLQELSSLAGELAREINTQIDGKTGSGGGEPLVSRTAGPDIESTAPWEDDEEYARLWNCLGYDPVPVDRIIEKSGLTARAVSAMLLMLELRGMVEAHPGGAYCRIKKR